MTGRLEAMMRVRYERTRPRSHTPHSASDGLSRGTTTWVMHWVMAGVGYADTVAPTQKDNSGCATAYPNVFAVRIAVNRHRR